MLSFLLFPEEEQMRKVGIIGGSGMDDPKLMKNMETVEVDTPYGVPSSPLTNGSIEGVDVVILARHGKAHSVYPTGVNFRANIHALREAGCTHILATTAVGSLREEMAPGHLVFPDQFLDFTRHRTLTFHDEDVVHTPMADPFCGPMRNLLVDAAKELGLEHHEKGTVVTIEGPRFSTRAESHMFRLLGADIINMSTVPEVVLAREAGICYQAIAMSTDYDCWKEDEEPVTWEMIMERMNDNVGKVKKLLFAVLPRIKTTDCEYSKDK
jgi:5'-methylthioadenosine phosphorylase